MCGAYGVPVQELSQVAYEGAVGELCRDSVSEVQDAEYVFVLEAR